MQKNHAKAIKGMSIACIVLSGLMILLCIIGIAVMGAVGSMVEEYVMDPYYYSYDFDAYDSIFGMYGLGDAAASYGYGYSSYGYDAYDELNSMRLALTFVNVFLVIGIIAEAICLVAGILALRNYNKPGKFGMVFGWSIAGAVLGFLGGGIVQCVLFIIIAVFINSDKKLYKAGLYNPAGAVAYPQPAPGAPVAPAAAMPGQQAPAPAPAPAPVAVAQPAVETQPAQPAAVQPQVAAEPVAQPAAESAAEPVVEAQPAQVEAQPQPEAAEAQATEAQPQPAAEPQPAQAEPAVVVSDEAVTISIDSSGKAND